MWFILGTCLEVIAWSTIIDAYGVPHICAGDPNCGSDTMFGDAAALSTDPDKCWLRVRPEDPYFDFLWEQPVTVDGVPIFTPGLANMTSKTNAPYAYRVEWANLDCPVWLQGWWCTPENVCTAQDKLNGACACTAAEQANNECTP